MKPLLKVEQYNKFKTHFSSESTGTAEDRFSIDFLKLHKRHPSLKEAIKKWNQGKADQKSKYLKTFSLENWLQLKENRKREHTFANCRGCAIRYAEIQAYFLVKSNMLKGKARLNPVFAAESEAQNLNRTPEVKPLQKDIKNTAKIIYSKIDTVFQRCYKTTFAEALSKVPELNLQHKTSTEHRS